MKTEETTGGCITWDNNAEDSGFVYNFETQKYDKYLGKPVQCDENGVEFVQEIIITDAPNLVTDVTDPEYEYDDTETTVENFTEGGPSDLTTVESIQLSTLSSEEFENDGVITVETVTEPPPAPERPKSSNSAPAKDMPKMVESPAVVIE